MLDEAENAGAEKRREDMIYAEEVENFQQELCSSSETVEDLREDKGALGEKAQSWIGRVSNRRQEIAELRVSYKANEERLSRAQDQLYSLEVDLRAEEFEKKAVQSQLSTAMSRSDFLKQSSAVKLKPYKSQLSMVKEEKEPLQSQLLTA